MCIYICINLNTTARVHASDLSTSSSLRAIDSRATSGCSLDIAGPALGYGVAYEADIGPGADLSDFTLAMNGI